MANFRLPEIRSITPRLRLQGLACYAHINFFSCWTEEQRTLSYIHLTTKCSAMFNACSSANICVGLGFIPPVALRIASWLATTKARFGVDVRETDKFKELTHLWATHANYLSRLQLKETARLKRVAKAPHLYRCANDGCEIQATNKSALRRCGGPCPLERKPRYCCELCQRQVRRMSCLYASCKQPGLTRRPCSTGRSTVNSARRTPRTPKAIRTLSTTTATPTGLT